MSDILSPDVYDKRVLALDPAGAIAIKRGQHTIDVGASAAALMPSFAATLQDPGRRFGLIELLRTADKIGKPYAVGERFQGRYLIEDAIAESLRHLRAGALSSELTHLFHVFDFDRLFDAIENKMLSDYGMITDLVLTPSAGEPHRLRYVYLEGTPIAGSLSIECQDIAPGICRLTQTTEYQEAGLEVMVVYGTSVLKMHNRVFYEMARQSADAIGASIVRTDIPEAYYRDPTT